MTTTKLYPTIMEEPSAPSLENENKMEIFRLNQISSFKKDLEADLHTYSNCKTRYKNMFNVLNNVQYGFEIIGAAGATSSIVSFCTAVGMPLSVIFAGVTAGFGALGFINHAIQKRIHRKLEKHTTLATLIESKTYSLNLLINKALMDGKISEEEYRQIDLDFKDYKRKKQELQSKKEKKINFLTENKSEISELNEKLGLLLKK